MRQTAEQEADLHEWLASEPNVAVHSHGGWIPEQWTGEVDGHSFSFRERGGDWDIEIDRRPSGRFMRVVDGDNDDGTTRYRQHEIIAGDIIATGTIYDEHYGETSRQRAAFIVTTIRDHLQRQACNHQNLDVAAVVGASMRWCPECGTRVRHADTDSGGIS